MASRWADDPAEIAAEAARKREKEAKKAAKAAAKAAQQRAAEEEAARRPKVVAGASPAAVQASDVNRTADADNDVDQSPRPTKRRRTSGNAPEDGRRLLHSEAPGWTRARTIEAYETLNHIEEGTYGSVSRGRERASGKIVAIKKMKMDDPNATGGFPITALREIETLNMVRGHKHIVELNEVVNGVGHDVGQVHLVMEFLEHDLKTLMDDMDEPWLPSETKTLMLQLGSALEFLHDHWILHRDLKTSNILMNNRGQIKIADFGMARFTSDPPPSNLTSLVVTLWYRSPELLLGTQTYNESVDLWSLGCVFGELLVKEPIMQGKNEVDQLAKTFVLCGIPDEKTWPGFRRLPNAKTLKLPRNASGSVLAERFAGLTEAGLDLLSSLLCLDPAQRISAKALLSHAYFREAPRPKSTAMFPTFPSKAGQEKRRKRPTPNAPARETRDTSALSFGNVFGP